MLASIAALALTGCKEGAISISVFTGFGVLLLADAIAVVGLTLAGTRDRPPGWVQAALSVGVLGAGAWAAVDALHDVQTLDPAYDLPSLISAYAFVGQPLVLWPLWLLVLVVHRRRRDPESRAAVLVGMALSLALLVATAVGGWLYI
jgi:hypothetical protein